MPPPDAAPPRTLAAHAAVYAVVGVCLALTPEIHRLHTSDSLIPVLASLYAWEPFYWDQDRVGLVWPLLAAPLSHPFVNLIAQSAAVIVSTLLVPLLLGLVVVRRSAVVPAAAGLVNVWYLAFTPELFIQNHFISSYHSSATAFALAGLLVLKGGGGWWRWAVGGALLAVAHWVYIAVVFFALPVAVVRGWTNPGREGGRWWATPALDPRSRAGVILTLVGFGVGALLMTAAASPHSGKTPTGTLPVSAWPGTMGRFLESVADLPQSHVWLIGLAAAAGVGVAACAVRRSWWALATAAGLVAAGSVEWAFMSTRVWSVMNLYHPRYILGTVSAWQLAVAVMCVAPAAGWVAGRGRFTVLVAVACGLAAGVVGRGGMPSASAVRAVHDRQFGQYTADVQKTGACVLAGEYWTVWPAVLHVNLTRYERGEPPVLGSTGRGLPWRWRWSPAAEPFLMAIPRTQRDLAERDCPYDIVTDLQPAGVSGSVELYWSRVVR